MVNLWMRRHHGSALSAALPNILLLSALYLVSQNPSGSSHAFSASRTSAAKARRRASATTSTPTSMAGYASDGDGEPGRIDEEEGVGKIPPPSFGSSQAAGDSRDGAMDDGRTLYAVLGASPHATRSQLKRLYIAKAKESHPDALLSFNPSSSTDAPPGLQRGRPRLEGAIRLPR